MIQSVNLYTQDLRPRRDALTLTQVMVVALLALAVMGLTSAYAHWRASEAIEVRHSAQSRISELHSAVTAAREQAKSRAEDSALVAELQRLNTALRHRGELLDRVERLASRSTEGFSAFMLGLSRQAVDGVWLTELEVDRETGDLSLAGLTKDGSLVPLYLEQLRSEEAFSGRRFRHFRLERLEDKKNILSFHVAAGVSPREAPR